MFRLVLALILIHAATPSFAQAQPGDPAGKAYFAWKEIACNQSAAIDSVRAETLVEHLGKLYRSDQFAPVEDVLTCLIASKARTVSGKPAASIAYQFFKHEMPAPGTTVEAAAQAEKWLRARPESDLARFAQVRLMYANAWSGRGGDYAGQVTDDGWRRFQQGVLGAEQGLLKGSAPLRGTPLWHHLMLAVVQDNGSAPSRADSVFEEAAKQWPRYFDFYEVRLTRLIPKWGGSWTTVDQFIDRWSEKHKAAEGISLYARLYASLPASGVDPKETRLDWPRMKASFDDLVARYPDSRHKNLAVSYACYYGDLAYLKTSIARAGIGPVNRSAWLPGTSMRECTQLLASQNTK